jgi:hypothetical protein
MHQLVDAGTDVAMIGAWDAARGALPFSAEQQRKYLKSLEKEAAAGHLFLIHTGADGGGRVDVYVDETMPDEVRHATRPLEGEFLVALPSGRLVVAGAEDYRSEHLTTQGEDSVIPLPAGDYAVRCHVAADDEASGEYDSLGECEAKVLTPEEREYYHKKDYRELALILVGWLLFLAFLPMARRWGWKIALPVTLVIALPYFHWLDRRARRRTAANTRWLEINKKLSDAWVGSRPRTFVLELRRVTERTGLKGGSVTVTHERRQRRGFEPVMKDNRD